MSSSQCVILVPVGSTVDPRCEAGLAALERRGYPVRRVLGFSAIDFGRSSMASAALADGFDELMWIDSDIVFHPDDVETLRGRDVPLACGVYAKKNKPEFACEFLPGTRQIIFGQGGELCEVCYSGCGFLLSRRGLRADARAAGAARVQLAFWPARRAVLPADAAAVAGRALVPVGGLRVLRAGPAMRVSRDGGHEHPAGARRQLRLRVGGRRPAAPADRPLRVQLQLAAGRCGVAPRGSDAPEVSAAYGRIRGSPRMTTFLRCLTCPSVSRLSR